MRSNIRISLTQRYFSVALSISFITTILILLAPVHAFSASFQRSKIPEEAVQHQLDCLKYNPNNHNDNKFSMNVGQAFDYNSPANQEATGPWTAFAAGLADPPFRAILAHAESSVLMTIRHDDGDYVCCLVKVVPGPQDLPGDLQEIIAEQNALEGLTSQDGDDDEDDEEEDESVIDDVDDNNSAATSTKKQSPCVLFWWEVSKQYDDDDDDNDDNYYYQVDSILPDAEDLELDYMETTLFAIGDDEDDDDDIEDDDDDDDLGGAFFFDLGLM